MRATPITNQPTTQPRAGSNTPLLLVVTLGLIMLALLILGPGLFAPHGERLTLGGDLPMLAMKEPAPGLTVEQVAALPDHAFTPVQGPFNQGYTRDGWWFRIAAPTFPPGPAGETDLWLELLPPYLDHVTLYQHDGQRWHASSSGDRAPMAGRVPVRQLAFPLRGGRPMLLHVSTTSPLQFEGSVRRGSALLAYWSHVEWASGLHQGVSLTLTLLIAGAALVLRMRLLLAMAVAAAAGLLHGAADQGYLQIWLPEQLAHLGDLAVKVGTLLLPAALGWQIREVMTRGTPWRRTDRALLVLGTAPALCLVSIPLGRYSDWAWIGIVAPWIMVALLIGMAWTNLRRQGATLPNVLLVGPSVVMGVLGIYIASTYLGWAPLPQLEMSLVWQFVMLMTNILITLAVGATMVGRYQATAALQTSLIERLQQSEQASEQRMHARTADLVRAKDDLQQALQRERQLAEEQRQFFGMINHEFRTPLAVIDSAAAEQAAFPSADLEEQTTRAVQIRRAARRLTTLVDNCLASDRLGLDTDAFEPQMAPVTVARLAEDAAQIARWSRRHQLHLDLSRAPVHWWGDELLLRIALSNLVDNAVKHGPRGSVCLRAWLDESGWLRLSVCDTGPGPAPEVAAHMFERGGRTSRHGAGFGLGLWVVRRVAQLHQGDVSYARSAAGACFTLTLPPLVDGAGAAAQPMTK